MYKNNFIPMLDLQLFADGGAAAAGGDGGTAQGAGVTAGAAGQQNTGVKAPAASGGGEAAVAGQEDPNAAFEALIKGKYKDQFNASVKKIVDGRVSGLNKQLQGFQSGQAVFDILAQKYGLDRTDYAGIAKAAETDRTFVEKEALETGTDPDVLLKRNQDQRKLARVMEENENFHRREQAYLRQQAAEAQEREWRKQAEEAKKIYPGLNLDEEIKNPAFKDLLRSGVPVRGAYQVIHMDEIMGGAMQYAAQRAAKNVTDNVIAGAARPTENGAAAQSAVAARTDVSKFSKEERADIIRRVARGETIRF